MRFDILREFACRGEGDAIRLNAYAGYDEDRAGSDAQYRNGAAGFHSALRDFGFKIILKKVRWYFDDSGNRYGKANSDLDMAVDALTQSQHLDRVVLGSGDGDFVQVVRALQNAGCRVEVVAFDNVSTELRQEADLFLPGYLVPNLLPPTNNTKDVPWGHIGSRVRGTAYYHHSEKAFGFMRFLKRVDGKMWITDHKNPETPFGTAFFHDSALPKDLSPSQLPSRHVIFEFDVMQSSSGDGLQATNIVVVSRLSQ